MDYFYDAFLALKKMNIIFVAHTKNIQISDEMFSKTIHYNNNVC